MAKKTKRTTPQLRHHYYSKMAFDGKTLVSESQKDDEPVRRRVYTLKQLKREIPLAGKFVEEHLDGKIPHAINKPIPKEITFRSVLPNPADLGLLPPRETLRRGRRQRQRQRQRRSRRKSERRGADNDQENMRLVVNDIADDNPRRKDVFGLPF